MEKIDFLTTPGFLTGPGAREEAGLPKGSGPYRVVTNLCIMGYDDPSKKLELLSVNPGVTVEQVIENTSFELLIADEITHNEHPTDEELKILRDQIDPDGLYR